ncbi:EI24 domain-containing protein [Rubellimicrobium aerolatum]|uniref:EI24 domain-containing protein n=1 Tax=Rubellimicrobium aerolatum TaxID=490979 RepID=A0ABW0SEC7_9RHOB|nr:EI24 domain-containing protein [Rubellimicrobium aerolatum]MBP1805681.1 uncharacterized protein involved in cysteine biosynthesis [Rubellimicrobium aerolatum]
MIRDVALALGQLPDRRFQRVLWRGVGLSVLLLGAASAGLLWAVQWLLPDGVTLPWWGEVAWLDDLAGWALLPVLLVLSVLLMVPVASAMTSLFLEEVAEAVEDRHYPRLPPAKPQPWSEAIGESLSAFGIALLANLLALAASLLLAPFAPLIFIGVNGLLLGREYFLVAAMRREGRAGAYALLRSNRGRVWLSGCLMAIPLFVPILNLVVPTLGAAAFTHLYHRLARGQSA